MMTTLFLKGGALMWPLLLCSILSLAIALERFVYFFKWKKNYKHVVLKLKVAAYANQGSIRDNMEIVAQEEIETLKKGLDTLDTIITMAPLLGILGTVVGIIDSFQLLGQFGFQTPTAVIAGISKALITTATGLSIALLTLVPYNYFVNRIKKMTIVLNKTIMQIETEGERVDPERV